MYSIKCTSASVFRVSSDSILDSICHVLHIASIQTACADTTILQQVDMVLAGEVVNLHR